MANFDSIKKKTDEEAAQKIAQSDKIYDDQYAATEKIYNQQIKDSDASYAKVYDRANVRRIVNERYAAEMAANMGLSNSGYNRTQQTQIMLSYNNAVLETDYQKAAAANTIRSQLASVKADIEAQKAHSAFNIQQAYDQQAVDTYNDQVAAEQAAYAAKISAQNAAKTVDYTQINNFKKNLADPSEFEPVTVGKRGNTGNGGIKYNGKRYRNYDEYVEDMIQTAYESGTINEATCKYLLTTVYNLY